MFTNHRSYTLLQIDALGVNHLLFHPAKKWQGQFVQLGSVSNMASRKISKPNGGFWIVKFPINGGFVSSQCMITREYPEDHSLVIQHSY